MWKSLFDWFIQFFSDISWSQFLAQHSDKVAGAVRLRNLFRNDLYPLAGFLFVAVTFVAVLIYYYVYNRKGGSGYGFKFRFWLTFLIATALTVGGIVLWIGLAQTKAFGVFSPFKFSLALSIASAIYSAILFFILSLFFKLGSVANRTPF